MDLLGNNFCSRGLVMPANYLSIKNVCMRQVSFLSCNMGCILFSYSKITSKVVSMVNCCCVFTQGPSRNFYSHFVLQTKRIMHKVVLLPG